ncbi:MAG: hypothetical protein C0519_16010, partial [Hyphomicrobium sp.]|nr:hypothetical protein [Hyphomicrobium sp.]
MNRLLLALTAVVTIAVVAVLAPKVMGAGSAVPTALRDGKGCLKTAPPAQTHAVLIDFTDRPLGEHLTHL